MSYKITKVSDSNFYNYYIEKYSNMGMSMMEAPESSSSSSDDQYRSIYYDRDFNIYVDDSKASAAMNKINEEISNLKELFNKNKILSDTELSYLKQYTYDYWMIFYWNKYKQRMNDPEFSKGMENRARMSMNQVSFQNTKGGEGIKLEGSEEIINIMQQSLKGVAVGIPVLGKAIAASVIAENLIKAKEFIISSLSTLKDSPDPNLKQLGTSLASYGEVTSNLLEKINLKKAFDQSKANIGDFVGYLVNIALGSITFTVAGNPAGASLSAALSAGKAAMHKAIFGSINSVYKLIKMILSSKSLKADSVKIFSSLWQIVSGPIKELLNAAAATVGTV